MFATSDERVASTAYADDLKLKTHTCGDARCQMPKVARFADWSGLKVNLKNCAFTALHAGCAAPEQSPLPFGPDLGYPSPDAVGVPWLPPSSPYRYLGVELTATLGWKADIDDCLASAAEKVNARLHHRNTLCVKSSRSSVRMSSRRPPINSPLAALRPLR